MVETHNPAQCLFGRKRKYGFSAYFERWKPLGAGAADLIQLSLSFLHPLRKFSRSSNYDVDLIPCRIGSGFDQCASCGSSQYKYRNMMNLKATTYHRSTSALRQSRNPLQG